MRIATGALDKRTGIIIVALLIALGSIGLTIHRRSSFERQIIRAIDRQCAEEGECTLALSELTDFEWDAVAVFRAGVRWPDIERVLGVPDPGVDIADGIMFSLGGKIVAMHTSAYDPFREIHPQLSYWVDGDSYKIYSRETALLRAQKIKRKNGGYRYALYG